MIRSGSRSPTLFPGTIDIIIPEQYGILALSPSRVKSVIPPITLDTFG